MKIDGFDRTHRTHASYAPANSATLDMERKIETTPQNILMYVCSANFSFEIQVTQTMRQICGPKLFTI